MLSIASNSTSAIFSNCCFLRLEKKFRSAKSSLEKLRKCLLTLQIFYIYNFSFKYFPVTDFLFFMISSGGPSASNCPPFSPPSGPKSIIQSAHFMRSRLCSITNIEWPLSIKASNEANSFLMS